MANLNLSEFTEKLFVADADHTFIWDTAASISKRVSRNSWLSGTTADFHLGLADAASPVAQTISVQSVAAGTTNTAGAAFTIDGSQGTGTGAGGPLIFRTAPAGSSGTAQNALATALSLTAPGYVVPKTWLLQNGFNYGLEMYGSDADALSRNVGNSRRAIFNGVYLVGNSGFSIGWSSNNGIGNDGGNFAGADTILTRDGVGTLALRNGAAAQTFNVYGTWTTAITNFERLAIKYNTTDLAYQIAAEKGTTNGDYRPLQLWTGGASRLHVSTAGNVGIGTTAPGAKLQVVGNAIFGENSISTSIVNVSFGGSYGTAPAGSKANLKWDLFNDGAGNRSGLGISSGVFEFQVGTGAGFGFYPNGGTTSALQIISTGNVGIGTTSPSSKLHVAGDVTLPTGGSIFFGGGFNIYGTTSGTLINGPTAFGQVSMSVNGVIKWLFNYDGLLCGGGTTAAFPALKRSSTTMQARLADDTAFAPIQGKLTTDTAFTATTVTPTGFITLYDSTGAAYKVPCVPA